MKTFQTHDLTQLPAELMDRPQWVAWKGEKKDNGKMTKIPIDPHTSAYAKANDPDTWGSYEDALECCQDQNFNSIGFMFTAQDPFVGIDFDNCIQPDGSLLPDVEAVIKSIDSYAEISPSGKGVHIIAKGKLPGPGKRSDLMEIYDEKRFFTMTGNKFPEASDSVAEADEAIVSLYHKLNANEKINQELSDDDAAVMRKAQEANNGEKFMSLWNGDILGYRTKSEADLALC